MASIYKGSLAQVTVAYLPCCYDVEQVSNVKLNFYTTTGSSVEFSGETLNLSGYTATVVFQPAQLELLDDGTLRFIAEFDYSGSPVVKDSCTIYYLKTPASYVPINPLTEENFSASTAVTEYIDGTITEALVDYVDEAELSDAMDAETARTEQTYLKEHQSLADYYTSAQTQEAISSALTDYYTSGQTDTAIANAVRNKVSSTSVTTLWQGTKAEYDAITVKDPHTLYFVSD